jgi:lactose/L-arabinose transport system permease protein
VYEKKKSKKFSESAFIIFSIGPVIIYFIVFMYYPFIQNIRYMFSKYNYLNTPIFVGMKNITHFFRDSNVFQSFKNTFVIAVTSVPILMVLSIFIAMALYYMRIGKAFFRSAIFTTYLTSLVVAAIIFKMLFGSEIGVINNFLQYLGFNKIPWLIDPGYAIIAVIILGIWKYLGYYVVIFMAGFSNVNTELLEASMIDGASPVQRFFYVMIPQLKPTIVFSIIIATITFLRTYPTVVVLTNGGPYSSTKTILMYMFEQGFDSRNVGYASVIAVALFLVILILTMLQMKLTKSFSEEG